MRSLPKRWQGNLFDLFLRCRMPGVAFWRSGDHLVFAPLKSRKYTLHADSPPAVAAHLDNLQKRIQVRRQSPMLSGSPRRPALSPGIFGFFSYDFGMLANGFSIRKSSALPLSDWGEYELLLIQHALRPGKITVVTSGKCALPDWSELFAETVPAQGPARAFFRTSDPVGAWHKGFTAAKRAIRAGELYQLNLARQFSARFAGSPRALFAALWHSEQAAHAAYFEGDGYAVLSASPESFLRFENGTVVTRPIKGTARRTGSQSSLVAAKHTLLRSAKEQAELHMITDLMRNDLAKFCQSGTVTVKRARALQALPGLYHTFAEITGKLKPELSELEAIVGSLPCGSISGCPKHAAIALIDQLEPRPREIFCGTLGSFADSGLTALSVLIRTIVWQPEKISYQAGSGLTIASERHAELAEIADKCRPAIQLRRVR